MVYRVKVHIIAPYLYHTCRYWRLAIIPAQILRLCPACNSECHLSSFSKRYVVLFYGSYYPSSSYLFFFDSYHFIPLFKKPIVVYLWCSYRIYKNHHFSCSFLWSHILTPLSSLGPRTLGPAKDAMGIRWGPWDFFNGWLSNTLTWQWKVTHLYYKFVHYNYK